MGPRKPAGRVFDARRHSRSSRPALSMLVERYRGPNVRALDDDVLQNGEVDARQARAVGGPFAKGRRSERETATYS